MTPLPKRRISRRRQGKRRAALHLEVSCYGTCPGCSALTRPHTICGGCGSYRGKTVIPEKIKKEKAKTDENQK